MRPRSRFWLLLKHELRLGLAVQAMFFLFGCWVVVLGIPYALLFGSNASRGNVVALFDAGFLPIFSMMFLMYLAAWGMFVIIPALGEMLSAGEGIPGIARWPELEFLLTRATDRRIVCRAKAAAFLLVVLTPFLLSVAISPAAPAVHFAPGGEMSADTAARQEKYARAFHANVAEANGGDMRLPHGAVAYFAWLAWGAAAACLLLQGYASLIAGVVSAERWWTALLPAAPGAFVLLWAIFAVKLLGLTALSRFLEESFLLSSAHPVPMWLGLLALAAAIEFWCERRFEKFEIK